MSLLFTMASPPVCSARRKRLSCCCRTPRRRVSPALEKSGVANPMYVVGRAEGQRLQTARINRVNRAVAACGPLDDVPHCLVEIRVELAVFIEGLHAFRDENYRLASWQRSDAIDDGPQRAECAEGCIHVTTTIRRPAMERQTRSSLAGLSRAMGSFSRGGAASMRRVRNGSSESHRRPRADARRPG